MLVFAVILLVVGRHQDVAVLSQTAGTRRRKPVATSPIFAIAMFMSLFVVYGFDTAGTFGEETLDASRQAPRGILSAIWLSGAIGFVFLLAIVLAIPDVTASHGRPGFPIATSIKALRTRGYVRQTCTCT